MSDKPLTAHRITAAIEWEILLPENTLDVKGIAQRSLEAILPPNISAKHFRVRSTTSNYGKKQTLEILGEFKPEEVFSKLSKTEDKISFIVDGSEYFVKMNSHRYFVFFHNPFCCACGIEGTKFLLEKNISEKTPHFNFYAEENGKLLLFTKDHIFSRAGGGGNYYSNYQTMCSICNNIKGPAYIPLEGIAKLRQIYNENKHLDNDILNELLSEAKKKLCIPRPPSIHSLIPPIDTKIRMNSDAMIVKDKKNYRVASIYEVKFGEHMLASLRKGLYIRPIGAWDNGILIDFNGQAVRVPLGLTNCSKKDLFNLRH